VTVTTHPGPLQPPLHPAKTLLAAGVAASVTWVLLAKFAVQVVGQLIPAGMLVTLPDPVPDRVIVRAALDGMALKAALTDVAAVMASVQVLVVPLHAPLHPAKVYPEAGVAVSVTLVFWSKLEVQVEGQLILVGALVTVPVAVVGPVTVN
jgi:hypothetical protein